MAGGDRCKSGGPTGANGNCTVPGPDKIPVQCVGEWAKDKHHYLQQYINATRAVRAGYLKPSGARPAGGAAFIDLFAGPGRARVRETGEIVDGSPLLALQHEAAPFSKVILCDLDHENIRSLEARTEPYRDRTRIVEGDCNERIDDLIATIPQYGLNIALIDPYGLSPLKFRTIQKLAQLKRMDLIIHFPTGDIKRNFEREQSKVMLDEFLGTTVWRSRARRPQDFVVLLEVLKEQLASLGYTHDEVRHLPIVNSTNVTLYHLFYASKHDRGSKIWNSIAKHDPSGQRGLF